ncbi:type II toxin-antitoxin system VapC family toxin [Mycobacterium crocinum]|uniref:Ribonuclease VapC n=1 Tax=Mycolicibacterium crocinum TaxID=388459 RepID=A0ABY3TU41_9MYCO|nr:type II toxin-antitoxin system VapC family toxin [Mycolicibacterium crocinum]MCV7215250.1 type II toxin-antitoxin system VapC family toxin [Mycolicibacterium crocinum]ULN44172.1 type II toxin-antitoxin system VapC family toxin [Mycolicibacterium crocinum]
MMQVYLDTSALMKLVVLEPETSALRTYLTQYPDDVRFTAALSRTELLRAARRSGSYELAAQAHRLLGRLDLVAMTTRLLDEAGTLGPPELRTLDAIHLAAARTAPALRGLVTYDLRLAAAAEAVGITVAIPQ